MTLPRLHVVTDDGILARPDVRTVAAALAQAFGPRIALHLRGPRTSGRTLFEHATALVPEGPGAMWVVNDRIDVARAVGLRAVHLGDRSLGVADARSILGPNAVVGRSVHSAAGAAQARAGGADFLIGGTVYETASHPGRPGGGAALVRSFCEDGGIPLLAIGGVTLDRVADIRAAGAYGAAVIRGVWDAPDPVLAAERYLTALEAGPAKGGAR